MSWDAALMPVLGEPLSPAAQELVLCDGLCLLLTYCIGYISSGAGLLGG